MRQHPAPLPGFPDIRYASQECHETDRYFWDNSQRSSDNGFVLQQTLSGSVWFQDSSGDRFVTEGWAMIFRHGENSRYGTTPGCQLPYVTRWTLLDVNGGLLEIFNQIRLEFGPILRMAPRGEASELLCRVREDFHHRARRDRLHDAETAFRLLIALYREQVAERRGDDPIAHGRHLLETSFRSPRNLKEWAGEIGLSREHFTREFHARYGETPAAFLRRLRLDHARLLLRTSHMDIDQIAALSGFGSTVTLHRLYRRHFGTPPGRERHGI